MKNIKRATENTIAKFAGGVPAAKHAPSLFHEEFSRALPSKSHREEVLHSSSPFSSVHPSSASSVLLCAFLFFSSVQVLLSLLPNRQYTLYAFLPASLPYFSPLYSLHKHLSLYHNVTASLLSHLPTLSSPTLSLRRIPGFLPVPSPGALPVFPPGLNFLLPLLSQRCVALHSLPYCFLLFLLPKEQ